MVIILILFLLLGFFISLRNATSFVIFYILASTKFLGFIDPASFIIGGVELGYFGLNIVTLISCFFARDWYVLSKKSWFFLIVPLALLVYGVLKPLYDGHSGFRQALTSSKELWFYVLFFYLVVNRKYIKQKKLVNAIKNIGLYLAIILIIGQVNSFILPPYNYNGVFVRVFFPTYISLALFFTAADFKDLKCSRNEFLLKFLILVFGLVFAGHFSISIMSVFCVSIIVLAYDRNFILVKKTVVFLVLIFFLLIVYVILFKNELYLFFIDFIAGVIDGNDSGLSVRDYYNEFRWDAIEKQKAFGYGFIHQSAPLMDTVANSETNKFMLTLGVIDSGYVDLLVKFGIVGTVVFSLLYLKYISLAFFDKTKTWLTFVLVFYLGQYFFVAYTWSVFTFAHGIIPACIAVFIIINNKELETSSQ